MRIPAARLVFPDEDRREILSKVEGILETGSLTLGPFTHELEEEFARHHGARFGVAVSSGTSALEIALRCLGVAGREVVVPVNTFYATAAAVVHAGGIPRFADVSASTIALSPASLEQAIGDQTAGVILVHIGGLITPEVDAIAELCRGRGIFLLEDAAHAHGSSYGGRAAGSFGAAAAFSFYPTKVMTSGEGGMILTNDDEVRAAARIYRDQGKSDFSSNHHIRMGSAWRMSELHAVVGLVQLRRLDEFIRARRRVAAVYDAELAGLEGLSPVQPPEGCLTNYYRYIALLSPGIDRVAFKRVLREEHDITLSGEVYEIPLHEQPVFSTLGVGHFPVASDLCRRHVCLPVYSDMSEEEALYVTRGVRDACASLGGSL
jgi:perosamine synthetase